MIVDGREITIDEQGARWAYRLGFFQHPCPFIDGTLHSYYWGLGAHMLAFHWQWELPI